MAEAVTMKFRKMMLRPVFFPSTMTKMTI